MVRAIGTTARRGAYDAMLKAAADTAAPPRTAGSSETPSAPGTSWPSSSPIPSATEMPSATPAMMPAVAIIASMRRALEVR